MTETPPSDVTRLLLQLSSGESDAYGHLMPLVYEELRRLAASQLRRERDEHTLGPTALVHEAFLRLVDLHSISWQGRSHFFGVAAQAMRRILVDHARRRSASKRGGEPPLTLDDESAAAAEAPSEEVLAVDAALETLARLDPRQAKVVELRYFVGFSVEETAEVLGVSPITVKRDWALARAWLQRELTPEA